MNKVKVFFVSIFVPLAIGTLVGIITSSYMKYANFEKPFFAPPGYIFPIVWTILFTLMGISYGILKINDQVDGNTKFIYYTQLVINYIWSFLFFVFDLKKFAFYWILLLITFVIVMIYEFYSKNKLSGLLQIPYLLWLIYASFINAYIAF